MKSISRSAVWPCLVVLALAHAACGTDSEPTGPSGSGGRPSGPAASGGSSGTAGSGGNGTGSGGAGTGGAGAGGAGGANAGGSSPDGAPGGAGGAGGAGGGGTTSDARGTDGAGEGPAAGADTWDSFALPFMVKYCVSCHNDDKAGASARDYHMLAVVMREKVDIACGTAKSQADRTSRGCPASAPRANQFPAGSGPKPTPDERDRLLRWIDANLP